MRDEPFEIIGADAADVDLLVAAISLATGLLPDSKTQYAAHFTAVDGITHLGVAPAYEGIGPATLFTLGPSGLALTEVVASSSERLHGCVLAPQG